MSAQIVRIAVPHAVRQSYLEGISQSVVERVCVGQDEDGDEEQNTVLKSDVLGNGFHALHTRTGLAGELDVGGGIWRCGFVPGRGIACLCSLEVGVHLEDPRPWKSRGDVGGGKSKDQIRWEASIYSLMPQPRSRCTDLHELRRCGGAQTRSQNLLVEGFEWFERF